MDEAHHFKAISEYPKADVLYKEKNMIDNSYFEMNNHKNSIVVFVEFKKMNGIVRLNKMLSYVIRIIDNDKCYNRNNKLSIHSKVFCPIIIQTVDSKLSYKLHCIIIIKTILVFLSSSS